jgi:uncharacterized protein with GYD domain
VVIVPMRVADIGLGLTVNKNGQARANAVVQAVDSQGRPVTGVTLNGWQYDATLITETSDSITR